MSFFSNKKSVYICAAALALGIILFVFGGAFPAKSENNAEDERISYTLRDSEDFCKQLELSLKRICECVSGVGSAEVMITLKSTSVKVYAQNQTETQSEYVVSKSGQSVGGMLVCEDYPPVLGVAVVCEGGSNLHIQKKLIDIISALFCISSSRISISGME